MSGDLSYRVDSGLVTLLGLAGYRRTGKDSAAKFLEQHDFRKIGFADALRKMCLAVDPLIELTGTPEAVREELGTFDPAGWGTAMRYSHILVGIGYEKSKEIPDVRRYMQKLGTEGVRTTFGPDAWVDALEHWLDAQQDGRYVISDVRFHSEADWIYRHGGIVWRINRPGYGGDDPHPSEIDIPNLRATRDITATNLTELEAAVHAAVTDHWPHFTTV